jgi:hypothetical protein
MQLEIREQTTMLLDLLLDRARADAAGSAADAVADAAAAGCSQLRLQISSYFRVRSGVLCPSFMAKLPSAMRKTI